MNCLAASRRAAASPRRQRRGNHSHQNELSDRASPHYETPSLCQAYRQEGACRLKRSHARVRCVMPGTTRCVERTGSGNFRLSEVPNTIPANGAAKLRHRSSPKHSHEKPCRAQWRKYIRCCERRKVMHSAVSSRICERRSSNTKRCVRENERSWPCQSPELQDSHECFADSFHFRIADATKLLSQSLLRN